MIIEDNQSLVNFPRGLKTERRSHRQQVRDRDIATLRLTFIQLPDGRWMLKDSRLKIPYDTYTAICLAKLQNKIRGKGHSWAIL